VGGAGNPEAAHGQVVRRREPQRNPVPQAAQLIKNITSVSEENSAAVEEVSAAAEGMSAQVDEVSSYAKNLAGPAENLKRIIAQFQL
jgi:methyl-accepting chemotaxis protein